MYANLRLKGWGRPGAVLLCAVLVACRSDGTRVSTTVPSEEENSFQALNDLGHQVPAARLIDISTDTGVILDSTGQGRLMLLIDAEDCFGCSGVVAEAWEAQRAARLRGMAFFIVISRGSRSGAKEFATKERLPPVLVLHDSSGAIATWLGPHPHPLILWVSRSGRLLGLIPRTPRSMPNLLGTILAEVDQIGADRRAEVGRMR